MDFEGRGAFEEHDVGVVDAVHVEGLCLEEEHDVGVFGSGLAGGIRAFAEGDGEGVGGLVDPFAVVVVEGGHEVLHAFVVGCCEGGEVFAGAAVEVYFGEAASCGLDVVVEVHFVVHVPEGEPILLDASDGRWSVEVCWPKEGVFFRSHRASTLVVCEGSKATKVVDVHSETTTGSLGAVDDIRRVRSIENACIVGADLIVKKVVFLFAA